MPLLTDILRQINRPAEAINRFAREDIGGLLSRGREALGQRLDQFNAPTPEVRYRDVAREMPEAFRQLFVASPARHISSLFQKGQELNRYRVPGGDLQPTNTPLSRFFLSEQDVLGGNVQAPAPIPPVERQPYAEATRKFLEKRNAPEELQKSGQFLVGFLGTTFLADPRISGGEGKATLKIIDRIGEGSRSVSKQFIEDLARNSDLRQAERAMVSETLKDYARGAKIKTDEFVNKLRTKILPLNRVENPSPRYEGVALPEDTRGPVVRYGERIYESPVENSAGQVHFDIPIQTSEGLAFGGPPNYFAHTRFEDLPTGSRRVIELQSDLFQKGRFDMEFEEAIVRPGQTDRIRRRPEGITQLATDEASQLEPYRNTWQERIIREEVQQAAQDGQRTLQFPTGETAMKIEGLGERTNFYRMGLSHDEAYRLGTGAPTLTPQDLRVGIEVGQGNNSWIITDVLGDGKFKAVPKDSVDDLERVIDNREAALQRIGSSAEAETFDISGKLDESNPIFRFYEKEVATFLQKLKPGVKKITDPQGETWWEVPIDPKDGVSPVQAFGAGFGFGADEEGNLTFSPERAAIGIAGVAAARQSPDILRRFNDEAIKRTVKGNAFGIFQARQEIDPQSSGTLKVINELLGKPTGDLESLLQQAVKGKGELPKWIPAELRRKDLLRQVLTDIGHGIIPSEKTKAGKLYEIVQNRINKTLGLSAKFSIPEVKESLRQHLVTEAHQVIRQLDDIPDNTDLPVIQALTENMDDLKDLRIVEKSFSTLPRNLQRVFGNRFPEVEKVILNPFKQAKTNRVNFIKQRTDTLEETITDGLGIRKGGKESAWVQKFGEGRVTREEVVQQFGETRANDIIEAALWFRREYDEMLDEVNTTRARIYPNNPEKQIPKRKDYFRHFNELTGLEGLKNMFETPAAIDPRLEGVSAFTQPNSRWQSFMQKRGLGPFKDDAVGGYLNYLDQAAYSIHIDPQISRFKQLRAAITDATAAGSPHEGKLNQTINYLFQFEQDLAGKTNVADRWLAENILGRKAFRLAIWAQSRAKANLILANAGSSLAQIFNVPQGIASAGEGNFLLGTKHAMHGLFNDAADINKSTFLRERYERKTMRRFEQRLIDQPRKMAEWMTSLLDEVGTKLIWSAHYHKAIQDGQKNPTRVADAMTEGLVAGRGIGEVPLMQKARTFQLIAPFQLEVGNQWLVMKDFVDERRFDKLVKFFAYAFLFNNVAEQVMGRRVSFDPLSAVIDSMNEDDPSVVSVAGRVGGEVLSNLPLGQTYSAIFVPEHVRETIFGESDPTRFGVTPLLAPKDAGDALTKYVLPFGGKQIEKSIKGWDVIKRGHSESQTGLYRYPVNELVKPLIFGEYSTKTAQAYFDLELQPLSEKQTKTFKRLVDEGANPDKLFYVFQRDRAMRSLTTKQKQLAKQEDIDIVQRQAELDAAKESAQRRLDELAEAMKISEETRDELSNVTWPAD